LKRSLHCLGRGTMTNKRANIPSTYYRDTYIGLFCRKRSSAYTRRICLYCTNCFSHGRWGQSKSSANSSYCAIRWRHEGIRA